MRPQQESINLNLLQFQFTHPGGVRLQLCNILHIHPKVSIHAPGRGATALDALFESGWQFQFTHPGGVRRVVRAQACGAPQVSIHAPGRGATALQSALRLQGLFQFTHPGGVRRPELLSGEKDVKFQFTHPGGVRLALRAGVAQCLVVSIHAPGRGATYSCLIRCITALCFNSRTREGCDDN